MLDDNACKHYLCVHELHLKSLMAEWLERASQRHEAYSHDLEVMSSNPGQVELGVHSTSVLSHTLTKHIKRRQKQNWAGKNVVDLK